jgi:hypothetical protein
MSERDVMSGIREVASTVALLDVDRVRARGDRWRVRHRRVTTTMASVLVLLFLGVVAIAVTAGGRREGIAPVGPATFPGTVASTAVSPPLAVTGTRPVVLRQGDIAHRYAPVSAAYGAGSLWLVFATPLDLRTGYRPPGTVDLVRVDVANFTVTAHWALPSSPQGLAVTDHDVWVADNSGRSSEGGSDNSDQVQEFDLTGQLVHTYSIPAAGVVDVDTAAAGPGDTAWVDYTISNGTAYAYLSLLHDGVADPPLPLDGAVNFGTHALAVCPDGIYVGAVHTGPGLVEVGMVVNRVVPGRPAESVTGLAMGPLACGARGGVVAIKEPSGPRVLGNLKTASAAQQYFVDGPNAGSVMVLPDRTVLLGSCAGGVWLGQSDPAGRTSTVWLADATTRQRSASLALPMNVVLGTPNGCNLWTVSTDPHHAGRWLLGAIVAR